MLTVPVGCYFILLFHNASTPRPAAKSNSVLGSGTDTVSTAVSTALLVATSEKEPPDWPPPAGFLQPESNNKVIVMKKL
jgi:hypothetical protein